nr:MBG domain-containing protein [Geomonas sp. Red32]
MKTRCSKWMLAVLPILLFSLTATPAGAAQQKISSFSVGTLAKNNLAYGVATSGIDATLTISWSNGSGGAANFSSSTLAGLTCVFNGGAAVPMGQTSAPMTCSTDGTTPAGSHTITVTQDSNSVSSTFTLTIVKGNPSVSAWPTASAITYGQNLASSTLTGGSAAVLGNFAFTSPGTYPGAGSASQGVTFTPSDTANYNSVTGLTTVLVNKAAPAISTLPTASAIVYKQPLSASTLTGGAASTPGTFAFSAPSTVPSAAGTYSAAITFTPDDGTDYNTASGNVNVAVGKASQAIAVDTAAPATAAPNSTFNVAAHADSSLPVAITASGVCSGSGTSTGAGSTVAITMSGTAGTCTVNYNQAGNGNYSAALQVSSSTSTTKLAQVIAFAPLGNETYGASDFSPAANGGDSGNPVTYTSSNPAVATITAGGLIHITGAGNTTITASQAGNDTYSAAADVAQPFTVDPAVITVTADNKQRLFGTDNPPFTATYSGFVKGDTVSVISGAPVFTTTADINSPKGSYDITVGQGTLAAVNYTFVFVKGTLAVDLASQTITFNPIGAKNYGDGSFDLSYTPGASGLPVTFESSNTAAATVSGKTVTITGAGSVTITASQAGNDNYAPATAQQTFNVAKAVITVTADNQSRAYNTANPPLTYRYSGFVNSEDQGVITGSPAISTTAVIDSPVDDYPITVDQGTLSAVNYSFTYVPGTLAVGKASQSIGFTAVPAKVYGDAAFDLSATGGASGNPVTFVSSNSAVATVNGSRVTIVGAGSTTITASQAGDANFAPATAQQTLNVGKGTITVTAADATRPYGSSNPAFTASFSGFAYNDTAASLQGAPSLSCAADASSPVAEYTILATVGDLFSNNYDFSYVNGKLTVTKATPAVTALPAASGIVFNQALSASTLSGGTASVDGTFAFTTPSAIPPAAGSYSASITFTPTDTTNYGTVSDSVNVAVAKASPVITVLPVASGITFNQALSASTLTGGAASVPGSFAFTTPSTVPSAAGSYSAAITFTPDSSNYSAVTASVEVAVAKAAPAITALPAASGITFNQALSSSTLSGGAASVPGSFAFSAPSTIPPAAGTYSASITFTPDSSNYNTVAGSVNVAVAKATPTITTLPAASGITFNQALSSSTLSGGTASVPGSFAFTTPSTVPSAAGTYRAPVTFTPEDRGNYLSAAGSVEVEVGKAAATVTVEALSQTYDGTPKAVTVTTNPGGLAVTITYAGSSSAPAGAGSYAVAAAVNDANYQGSANVTLVIAPAAQSIAFSALSNKSYGDADFGPGAVGGASGNAVTYTSSDPAVATITAGGLIHIAGAGTATITASQAGNDNYSQAAEVAQPLTVDKALLTVTAGNANRAFGAPDPVFTATYTGFVNGETASVLTGAPSFSTNADAASPAGSYTLTPALGTLTAANYSFAFVNGTFAVGLASQTITFNPVPAKTYGAADFDLSFTPGASGEPVTFASSDSSVATVSGATVTIVGAGTATITASQPGNANYASATAQQDLNVAKALVTVTAQNASRAYNAPNPPLTYLYSGFVNGQTEAVLTGTPAIGTTAVAGSLVGSYPITVAQGSLSAANYSFAFVGATLAIDQASQSIVLGEVPGKVYGDAPFDLSATGGASGNPVAFASSNAAVATVSGNTVTITGAGTATITASQAGDANYAPATNQLTLNVQKASLTVTAADAARPYNTANPELTATFTGFVNNDTLASLQGAPALSCAATASSPVGGYPIIATVGNLSSNNYTFSYLNGTLTVGKATPVITWGNPADIFTGTPLSATQLNAAASVPGSFSYTPALGTVLPVGSAETLTVEFIPDDPANYAGTSKSVAINVAAKMTATVTLGNLNQVYDGNGKSVTVTTSPGNLEASITYNGSVIPPTVAGSYTVLATVNDSRYEGGTVGTLVISKASATVTLGGLSRVYNGNELPAAVTTTPAGLAVGLTYNGSATVPVAAGSYVAAATVNDTNYQGNASGTLTIAKAAATVTLGGLNQLYNGSAKSATASTSPGGLAVGITYNGSATVPSVVGSYTVVATVSDANYSGSATGTMIIAQVTSGVCGSANGQTFASAPASNLCSSGTASSISGSGPWGWSCSGTNGASTAFCTASKSVPIPPAVAGPPSGSFAAVKSGASFTVSRISAGGAAKVLASNTTETTFTDTSALLPNTVYQYSVVSDTDPTETVFMTIRTPLYNGWNIVAVPYQTAGVNPSRFFASTVSVIYQWVPSGATSEDSTTVLGSYNVVSGLNPGNGYFVKAINSSTMLTYSGTAGPATATVPLKPGWTMIANPNTVNKTNVGSVWQIDGKPLTDAIAANQIGGSFYWWNGTTYDSWTVASDPVIEPWKGYWILNLDSVNHTLTIK